MSGNTNISNRPLSVPGKGDYFNDNNLIGAGYRNEIHDSVRSTIINGVGNTINSKINCHIIGDYLGHTDIGTDVDDHTFNIGCYNGVVSYGPLTVKRGGAIIEEGQLTLGASPESPFEGGQLKLATESNHGTNEGLIMDAFKDTAGIYFHGTNQWIHRWFTDSSSGRMTFSPGDASNDTMLIIAGDGRGHEGIWCKGAFHERLELKNPIRAYIDFSIENLLDTTLNEVDYNVRLMQGRPGSFFNGLEQVASSLYIRSSASDTIPANLYVQGDIIAYSLSDKNLKDNIVQLDNCLSNVLSINPVRFTWNKNQSTYSGEDIGLIAQEVKEIIPEVVQERENGTLAIRYEKLVPSLVGAIQEQQSKIESLEKQIEEIKKKL